MNKNLLRGAYVAAMSGGLLLLANTAAHADEGHDDGSAPVTGDNIASTASVDAKDPRYAHHHNPTSTDRSRDDRSDDRTSGPFDRDRRRQRVRGLAGVVGTVLVDRGVDRRRQQRGEADPGPRELVAEDVDPAHVAMIRRRGMAVVLGAVTALAVALVEPFLAQAALASIFLWRRLLDALHRGRINRAGGSA